MTTSHCGRCGRVASGWAPFGGGGGGEMCNGGGLGDVTVAW